MAIETPDQLQCAASVPAQATPGVVTTFQKGCVLSSHPAVGRYVFTLDAALAAAESFPTLAIIGAPAATGQPLGLIHTSDTVKEVQTFVGGVLSDAVAFTMALSKPIN
jgi:hypothetical protein